MFKSDFKEYQCTSAFPVGYFLIYTALFKLREVERSSEQVILGFNRQTTIQLMFRMGEYCTISLPETDGFRYKMVNNMFPEYLNHFRLF